MDQEMKKQVEKLQKMYPKPRVGQVVKLRNGKMVEIITVRRARDVLKGMREVEAMMVGPRMQALYGRHWLEIYFEAEGMVPGVPKILKVTPVDIEPVIRS